MIWCLVRHVHQTVVGFARPDQSHRRCGPRPLPDIHHTRASLQSSDHVGVLYSTTAKPGEPMSTPSYTSTAQNPTLHTFTSVSPCPLFYHPASSSPHCYSSRTCLFIYERGCCCCCCRCCWIKDPGCWDSGRGVWDWKWQKTMR